MTMIQIPIKNTSDLPLPQYQTAGAAAFDARATEAAVIEPHKWAIVPTGIHIALPDGCELQVRGRSGLAAKHGIGLVNGIGTIDSDYRGEIKVILINYSDEPFTIERGDRIAQCVVTKYERAEWQLVEELEETERGDGKFGSTGRN